MFRFPGTIFILAATLALHTANGAEVNVYAAASLTDVLKEIAANYEKQLPQSPPQRADHRQSDGVVVPDGSVDGDVSGVVLRH